MPIFARTKMVLQEECFNFAGPELVLEYRGPDPQLAYSKIRESFLTIFGVKETERVQEKEYTWNRSGKKETFKVSWHITKDMDRFSYLYYKIKMSGFAEQTKNGKEGELKLQVVSYLRTEYPQDNVLERSIFYEIARVFWHKVFYQEKRWEYMDVCRTLANNFKNEIRSLFNLMQRK